MLLLENVRFHKEEEKNDPAFAKELASLAEIYVNDAFGTAHRAHASTAGVADYLPAVCGYLIEKEISVMGGALNNPTRPFVAILGGAKVADKLRRHRKPADEGGHAHHRRRYGLHLPRRAGQGHRHVAVRRGETRLLAKDMLKKAEEKGVKLLLPVDNGRRFGVPRPDRRPG